MKEDYKYVLLYLQVQDGERRYDLKGVHAIGKRRNVDKFGRDYASEFYGGKSYKAPDSEWYEFDGGCVAVRVSNCYEIPKEHYEILNKYL